MQTLVNTLMNFLRHFNFNSIGIVKIFAFPLLVASSAVAGSMCIDLFPKVTTGNTTSSIIGSADLVITGEGFNSLHKLFQKEGITLKSNDVKIAIDTAFDVIKRSAKTPSTESSDRMARLSREMLNILKKQLNQKQYLLVNYLLAESVLRLETIDFTEFKNEPLDVLAHSNTLPIGQFNKYVESYVDGTDLYRELRGKTGLLDWDDARSLYANNSWIISLKDHDMHHLHYAYGHPYYLAVNMLASRSVNDRRYFMISHLWESIDDNQTKFERGISRLMSTRGMTPQQGMLFLAVASQAELKAIETEMGQVTHLADDYTVVSYENGWRPSKSRIGREDLELNPQLYINEIRNYINANLKNRLQEEKAKYRNYHREGPGKSVDVDQDAIVRFANDYRY